MAGTDDLLSGQDKAPTSSSRRTSLSLSVKRLSELLNASRKDVETAVLDLAHKIATRKLRSRTRIQDINDIGKYLVTLYGSKEREYFGAVYLDAKW